MKLNKNIHKSYTDTRSVSLHTGGFVQLEKDTDKDQGYLKIHLGKIESEIRAYDNAWRWIKHGSFKDSMKLAKEIRDALTEVIESFEEDES